MDVALIGLIIGCLLGLTGAGGSIFAVPMLMLLGLGASNAMGLALGAVAASAAYGVILQRQRVLWMPSLILAFGGMLTAPLGKYLASRADDQWLVLGFAALSAVIAWRMLRQSLDSPELTKVLRADAPQVSDTKDTMMCRLSPTGQFQLKPKCVSGLVGGGLAIGFTSGLFGVGGGFLIVPMLLWLSALTMQAAVATSLFSIALISSAGFASHLALSEDLQVTNLIVLIVASIGGMLLSQQLGKRIAGPRLQQTFAILLLSISAAMIIFNL